MLGLLQRNGIGTPLAVAEVVRSDDELRAQRRRSNEALVTQLRECEVSERLHDVTVKDSMLGRMSVPMPVSDAMLEEVLLQPRFGVMQLRADGSLKLRAVDHFSWSTSGNANCTM